MENGKKGSDVCPQGWRKAFFAVFLLFLCPFSFAQFYTGSEQSFGRKRVQYDRFIWMYYRFDGFDVYFTNQGKNLALYTANYVQNHLHEMEEKAGVQAAAGLRFIVFNRLTDLKQSNIGYLDEASESNANKGGVTRFLDNKVFLYFEGDYLDFERQIRRGMAEMLVSQAITGAKVGAQYRNSYVMDLPRWFSSGLASYLGRGWDEELDERMAASVRQKDFRYFWGLEGEEAEFAGHSFWYFIEQTFGADAVTRCIRVVSREKRLNKTFSVAFNASFKEVMNQWREFYLKLYSGVSHADSAVPEVKVPRTGQPDRVYQRFVLNDGGKEAAFVSNNLGRAKAYLQSSQGARRHCIYRTGAAINDNPDYSFPLLCFHPDGNRLGIMTEEKGRTTLIVYDIERNKKGNFKYRAVKRNTMRYYLDMFDKVNSFSFSPDGRSIALGATNNGYPDIYLFRLGAGTRQRLTYDLYDDYDPVFVPGTDLLVFSSNRPNDSIKKGEKFEVAPSFANGTNLFAYDLKEGGERLFAMTDEDARTLLRLPQVRQNGQLVFTSNLYGQTNLALGQLGKTISHIDTAIHYRNTFNSGIVTDFEPGLEHFGLSERRGEYARVQRKPNRKGFYTLSEGQAGNLLPDQVENAPATPSRFKAALWEKERRKAARIAYQDSLRRAAEEQKDGEAARLLQASQKRVFSLRNAGPQDNPPLTAYDLWLLQRAGLLAVDSGRGKAGDSARFLSLLPGDSAVLADNPALAQAEAAYRKVLGVEKGEAAWVPLSDSAALAALMASIREDDTASAYPKIPPKQHMYEVEYSVNSSTAQLGFNYLNACYQAFTNSQTPLYLNAAASGFTQISISDLMENHRLIGGFAFSLDFSSTEYLFSYEYLERRLGHQLVLHMSNLNDNTYYPYKQNTYDAYYIAKYPLSPVSSLRGTVFGRYDRTIYQAIDYLSLTAKTRREMRVGLKGEWVYDHSRFITQNIYFGTRGKVWLEYYQGVLNNHQNLFVFGVDFRDYRRLYKNLIWANRIAFSTSFGQQKLCYYMGGVDGWVGAKFNRDVETDPNQNYAYQTLATNMRGFHQNIRNGNTFAVINSEIRFPFMQVLSPRPVQSSFLRHLQLIFFGDIGSAWSGWNPWSKDNLFYKKTIEDGKLTVVLDKDANPIVGGFGFGLRMQVLGYFLRGDLAWGVENGLVHKKPVFYFSLSTDF
ncbi:MAG: hypothetical protein NC048_02020 [Bacteroides sp.]|nr:hypothetical protein [Ruminococcus flavefaciens]MCM1554256.1 hypothetical protein [Bacteroides sp.]